MSASDYQEIGVDAVPERKEIDRILSFNLEQSAIDLMWDRVERLSKTKKLFIPNR
jgi:hypothetical protein